MASKILKDDTTNWPDARQLVRRKAHLTTCSAPVSVPNALSSNLLFGNVVESHARGAWSSKSPRACSLLDMMPQYFEPRYVSACAVGQARISKRQCILKVKTAQEQSL